MMKRKETINSMFYGFDDFSIIPRKKTYIKSRSECNIYKDDMLPIFTAPMGAVIDDNNYVTFNDHKVNTIIPLTVDLDKRLELATKTFVSLDLKEFEDFIKKHSLKVSKVYYICVDVANGHMDHMIDLCAKAKEKFGGFIRIITGNIANPDTYFDYAKAGIDGIRCSIGTGSACLTASNTGCYMSMPSLIAGCNNNKMEVIKSIQSGDRIYKSIPFIIADGGLNRYDKIIKILALGADYVMLGGVFAKCAEACSVKDGVVEYYGMSTKRVQKMRNRAILKTSEGIEYKVNTEYSLAQWIENFADYLRSAMSYTDSKDLEEFKNCQIGFMTRSAFNDYFK